MLGKDLGKDWTKVMDSRLILAAYKHNNQLQAAVDADTFGLKAKAMNPQTGQLRAAFKDRWARLLNHFLFRGAYHQEIGLGAGSLPPPSVPPAGEAEVIDVEVPATTAAAAATEEPAAAAAPEDEESDIEMVDLATSDEEEADEIDSQEWKIMITLVFIIFSE